MWDILSKILNIILAILTIYFYFENRRLKGFEIEKKLTMKMAELIKLINQHNQNSAGTMGSYGFTSVSDMVREESEFDYKKICLEAEIAELEKIIKRYNLR